MSNKFKEGSIGLFGNFKGCTVTVFPVNSPEPNGTVTIFPVYTDTKTILHQLQNLTG
jgi:hypothetical protein